MPNIIFQLYLKLKTDLFQKYIIHDITKYDINVAIAAPKKALFKL